MSVSSGTVTASLLPLLAPGAEGQRRPGGQRHLCWGDEAQLLVGSFVWKRGQPAAASTCPCWIPAFLICPGRPRGVVNGGPAKLAFPQPLQDSEGPHLNSFGKSLPPQLLLGRKQSLCVESWPAFLAPSLSCVVGV